MLFQLCYFASQVLMTGKHRPQLEKCTHDSDVNLNRAITVEHAGKHGGAVLCECIGKIPAAAMGSET